jgi:hypothetical protein
MACGWVLEIKESPEHTLVWKMCCGLVAWGETWLCCHGQQAYVGVTTRDISIWKMPNHYICTCSIISGIIINAYACTYYIIYKEAFFSEITYNKSRSCAHFVHPNI